MALVGRLREPLRRLSNAAPRLLASRRVPLIAALLSIALALPAVGAGWIMDDYYHRAILLGRPRFRDLLGGPSEMFRFFRGDPVRMGRELDLGMFPWWTDPSAKAEFLQALTVLTHRLDYALWPDSPEAMHAHSLLWLGLTVAAAALFYRRMLGPTITAGVAALLFAVDDARGATAGFLANRNVLVAAAFGISALVMHDRWRRDGSRAAALVAPWLLAAALFAKEEGIGTCAYLGAYGLCADRAGRVRGCLALVPYAVVLVVWRLLRGAWGYGVRNVGVYFDPITEPARFFSALLLRIPVLLFGQWTPVPAESALLFGPRGSAGLVCAAILVLGVLAYAFGPLLKRDHVARFWGVGMLLATVPVCATFPMDRLLTFVGIGAFGLLAQFWAFVFGGAATLPPSRTWRVLARPLAWVLVVIHAVLAPLVLPFRAANPVGPARIERRLYFRAPLGQGVQDRTAVILNAPSPGHAGYLIFLRDLDGLEVPRHTRVLAPAMPGVTIRRLDDRTLAIRPDKGYLHEVLDHVFRSEQRPLARGERVRLSGMTAEVTALTPDGRPAEVTFRFDVPLESPELDWFCYRSGRFVPIALPAVGSEVRIPFDFRALIAPEQSDESTSARENNLTRATGSRN